MDDKLRILVIDDSRPTAKILSSVLQKQGYEVFVAYNGMEGLMKAKEVKPHLIILDIIMPGMDGYTVCQRLQKNPETAHIAVLILSARGDVEEEVSPDGGAGRALPTQKMAFRIKDQLHGFDSGAIDFLSKPVKAKVLLQRVKSLLWASGVVE